MSLQRAILSPSFGVLLKKTAPSFGVLFKKTIQSDSASLSNGRRTGSLRYFSTVNKKNIVLFHPFEEVKKEEFIVPISPRTSLSRQLYADECEAAVNKQINVEYSVAYVYKAMQSYLERDNIALKGIAKFFESIHINTDIMADLLIEYQIKRGGRVKLNTIVAPPSEFEHAEKGDALYAMELALSLEKLGHQKLLSLHAVARKNNDPHLEEYIEYQKLQNQVKGINILSNYVSQLRKLEKGHGVWKFDQQLPSKWMY